MVAAVLPRVRDIRRGGSARSTCARWRRAGWTRYYERGLHYWDYAAGGLIAAEAGARVAGLAGGPPSPELCIAASPELFRELRDLLASLDPERDAPE